MDDFELVDAKNPRAGPNAFSTPAAALKYVRQQAEDSAKLEHLKTVWLTLIKKRNNTEAGSERTVLKDVGAWLADGRLRVARRNNKVGGGGGTMENKENAPRLAAPAPSRPAPVSREQPLKIRPREDPAPKPPEEVLNVEQQVATLIKGAQTGATLIEICKDPQQ